jgi:hypothetical protein
MPHTGIETTLVPPGANGPDSYPAAVRRLRRPLLESAPDDLPAPAGPYCPQMLRTATIAVLGLRVAYGVALIAAPERLALRWLGPAAGTPPAQVPLRGLGAREIVVHGAAIAAATRDLPLRPFLAASVAGDLADIAATVAGRRGLPDGAAPATLAVAGGSALLTAALAAAVER